MTTPNFTNAANANNLTIGAFYYHMGYKCKVVSFTETDVVYVRSSTGHSNKARAILASDFEAEVKRGNIIFK